MVSFEALFLIHKTISVSLNTVKVPMATWTMVLPKAALIQRTFDAFFCEQLSSVVCSPKKEEELGLTHPSTHLQTLLLQEVENSHPLFSNPGSVSVYAFIVFVGVSLRSYSPSQMCISLSEYQWLLDFVCMWTHFNVAKIRTGTGVRWQLNKWVYESKRVEIQRNKRGTRWNESLSLRQRNPEWERERARAREHARTIESERERMWMSDCKLVRLETGNQVISYSSITYHPPFYLLLIVECQ